MKKIISYTVFILLIVNLCFSVKALDLPKYFKFPKNYLKGKFYNSTKNFFIVATKEIIDPRFKNSVIYMLDHDKDGALGIIINKPIGKITIGSLVQNMKDKKINREEIFNYEIPIFWGGPIDNDRILILHSNDYNNESTKKYKYFSVSNDYESLVSIADENGPTKSLVVVGISAWTVGQLDGEIDKGHWNLSEVKEELIFEEDNEIKFIKATNDSFLRL